MKCLFFVFYFVCQLYEDWEYYEGYYVICVFCEGKNIGEVFDICEVDDGWGYYSQSLCNGFFEFNKFFVVVLLGQCDVDVVGCYGKEWYQVFNELFQFFVEEFQFLGCYLWCIFFEDEQEGCYEYCVDDCWDYEGLYYYFFGFFVVFKFFVNVGNDCVVVEGEDCNISNVLKV